MENFDQNSPREPQAPGEQRARPTWPSESPLFVLLACWASLGFFVPFWVLKIARSRPAGSALSHHPRALALVSISPMMVSLVLAQIVSELNERSEARVGRGVFSLPILHFGFALAFGLSALGDLWTASTLLLALPIAALQIVINRSQESQEAEWSGSGRILRVCALTLGVAGLGLVFWQIDLPAARSLAAVRLVANERVFSEDGSISIRTPSAGWSRAAPGTLGDEDAALELVGPEGVSWIVVYSLGPFEALNDLVIARREVIESVGQVQSSSAKTFFWDMDSLDRASVATFTLGDGQFITQYYEILTLERSNQTLEVIGFSARPPGDRPDFQSALASLGFEDD